MGIISLQTFLNNGLSKRKKLRIRWYNDLKKDTKFTIWHWTRHDKIPYENVETEKIEINPPDIDYHHGDYFMLHRITING